jgi:hypothetical protein
MQSPWHYDAVPAAPAEPTPGPASPTGVSALAAVKAVFADPEWKHNVLFGLVFLVIPVVGPIAMSGWLCESHQRLVRGHPRPIPYIDFADFGDYIKRGLTLFVINLVITVPVLLLTYAFLAGAGFGTYAVIAATDEPLAGLGVGLLAGIVAVVCSLVLSVFVNAAHTRAELTESFGTALQLGALIGYAKATAWRVIVKNFFFMWIAIGIVLLGMLACYFGVYPAAVVLQIAGMHLRFQIYSDYRARGGEPIVLKEIQPLQSELRAQQQAAWTG